MGGFFMLKLSLGLMRRVSGGQGRLSKAVGPGLLFSLVRAGNRYFRKAFAATPYSKRLLFLPLCLRPPDCQAFLDPGLGYICREYCPDCELGKLRRDALGLGYGGVYVVPSSRMILQEGIIPSDQFMLEKVKQHGPTAVLGVACLWYVRHRLLAQYTLGRNGYASDSGHPHSVVQGVLLENRNCRKAAVDWGQVRERLYLRS